MTIRSTFGAESAHDIDDEAYHQQQSDTAAANGRTAKVKATAAEQKEQYQQND